MNLLLTALAVLPAIVLCIYVFKNDRTDKEPVGLLLLLFGLGMLSCFPAGTVESLLISALDAIFAPFGYINTEGILVLPGIAGYLYTFIECFFIIAPAEEGYKFLILYLVTKKNKNFNCLFDGIIYAVFVSLGFAALENVFYVLSNGFMNAVTRAILSVPSHMFFAVFMGYYYTFWHVEGKIVTMEGQLRQTGLVPAGVAAFVPGGNRYKALLVPILAHGVYNFCCSLNSVIALVIFVMFVGFMYTNCFLKIQKLSYTDGYSSDYAKGMLVKKYPGLEGYIREEL